VIQPLKIYWPKQGISGIWLVQDLSDPWNKDLNWHFCPDVFKKNYPGACFFSRFERSGIWVKVWLYNSKVFKNFQTATDRESFVFWINPTWLEEIPL
jgi:hypothetical protein